jgi:hypothetical protein
VHARHQRELAGDDVVVVDTLKRRTIMTTLSRLTSTALLLAASAASAHHSPIIFDRDRTVTIVGIVTEFKWSSPHAWIRLDVKGGDGTVGNWGVEMNPESLLAKEGWRSSTVKPGDRVSITVHPLRTNELGGQFVSIKLPDGRTLGEKPDGVL